jgi:murein L,D-transpeptidase YcbB/YkuD
MKQHRPPLMPARAPQVASRRLRREIRWAVSSSARRSMPMCSALLVALTMRAGAVAGTAAAAPSPAAAPTGGARPVAYASPPPAAADSVQEAIRARMERLREGVGVRIGASDIASTVVVPRFYERRGFAAAWSDGAVRDLLGAIVDSEADGLLPRDYHLEELLRLRSAIEAGPVPADVRADYEVLLTDAAVRLGYHLAFGKVDPEALDAKWNLARDMGPVDPADMLARALDEARVRAALDAHRPAHFFYHDLRRALADYRAIAARGGWPAVPDGPTLRPGDRDPRVAVLRERLAATGDLDPAATGGGLDQFDDAVAEAVRAFQTRHGLEVDGAVGPVTRRELNVPVEARIAQMRINLERGRWVLHDLADTFIAVNIAGYTVYLVREGRVAWSGRAVVGQTARQTPVFRALMTYVVFNPTWTVPPGILRNDILPAVRRDPGYLASRRIRVLDRSGRPVDPATIDWHRVTAAGFPWVLEQEPGPHNALGRVKLMFPNPYMVYLHDTPQRELFERDVRAFSSGCIRVDDPLELTRLVLDDERSWNAEAIRAAVDRGTTRTVNLTRPVPVLVLYWTAWVGLDGRVQFRRDVYQRDAAVLAALEAEFRFRARAVIEQG